VKRQHRESPELPEIFRHLMAPSWTWNSNLQQKLIQRGRMHDDLATILATQSHVNVLVHTSPTTTRRPLFDPTKKGFLPQADTAIKVPISGAYTTTTTTIRHNRKLLPESQTNKRNLTRHAAKLIVAC
jgi:hypothetical protein